MKLRRVAWAAAVAVAVVLIGGVAYASIPGPDGTIHGCYKTSNPAQGSVIVVDSSASCPNGYTTLSWNQTGPQGPSGVLGYEVVWERSADTPPGLLAQVDVSCPSGKVATGGGYGEAVTSGGVVVWEISANAPNAAKGWVVIAINVDTSTRYIDAYAVCATEG